MNPLTFDQILVAADRLASALGLTPAERLLYIHIHLLRLACHPVCAEAAEDSRSEERTEGSASRSSEISDLKSAIAAAVPQHSIGRLRADQSPDHQSPDCPIPSVLATKRQLASAIGVCPTTVRHALRALARAGCIRIVALLGRRGFHLEIVTPSDIPSLEPGTRHLAPLRGRGRSTGRFRSPALRAACFARQHGRCFYCLRVLQPDPPSPGCHPEERSDEGSAFAVPSEISDLKSAIPPPSFQSPDHQSFDHKFLLASWSLDHVVPVASGGDDSPSNAVAACHECNCKKGETSAADFLRLLYRRSVITARELESRKRALQCL